MEKKIKQIRQIKQIDKDNIVGGTESCSSDIWELRMKLREVIRTLNTLNQLLNEKGGDYK